MSQYKARVSISHGQGREKEKKVWNVAAGQIITPSEMGMTDETVQSLLSANMIAPHDGSDSTPARPMAVNAGVDTTPKDPDPQSSVGVSQDATAHNLPGAGANRTGATSINRSGPQQSQMAQSRQGAPGTSQGGSTQGGKPTSST